MAITYPALAIDTSIPQDMPDGFLKHFNAGYDTVDKMRKGYLSSAAGSQLAGGDAHGAFGTLASGGMIKEAKDISDWDVGRKLKMVDFFRDAVGRTIDPATGQVDPNKYGMAFGLAKRIFGDSPEMQQFSDPRNAPNAISHLDNMKMQLERMKAEAAQTSANAQMITARPHAALYDAQARSAEAQDDMTRQFGQRLGVFGQQPQAPPQAPVVSPGNGQASPPPQYRTPPSVPASPPQTVPQPAPSPAPAQPSPAVPLPQPASPQQQGSASPANLDQAIAALSPVKKAQVWAALAKRDFEGAMKIVAEGAGEGPDVGKAEADLRKELATRTKDFQIIRDGYARIVTGAADTSGVGDIAVVYGYMKMLDPGSVVREGEYATAENASGIPARVIGIYNRVLSGEKLPPQAREDFVRHSKTIYDQSLMQQEAIAEQYRGIATRGRMNPGNVIVDERVRLPPAAQPGLPPGQKRPSGPAVDPTIPRVKTIQDAMRLPSGTKFYDPQGELRVRP